MSDTSGTRRLAVYAIPESKDGEKRYWPRLGIAFANRDGSINLILEALPLGTNRLQVRDTQVILKLGVNEPVIVDRIAAYSESERAIRGR